MIDYRTKAETATIRRLITEIYPMGIVSYVSDSFNLWSVVSHCLPKLKDIIMNRSGSLIIRPDSGDPVDILCGSLKQWQIDRHPRKELIKYEEKGLIECLWDIFGGTINSKGYKQLDPHIGAIYGDSITLERASCILDRLERKGFASTNIVFGIGSYTYQYNTRDTFGWTVKSTYCEINGEGRAITKDPITDDGTKRSHSGLLKVVAVGDLKSNGYCEKTYHVLQNQTWEQFHQPDNELKLVYDGAINEV